MIADEHEVNFQLQRGLQMINVQNATEEELKTCPVVAVTSDMLWNPEELSRDYVDLNRVTNWDYHENRTIMNKTAREILHSRLDSKTLGNQRVTDDDK